MSDQCANSPCAGLNGCTHYTDFANMNKCLMESCYCSMAPWKTSAPSTLAPPCVSCGQINQCDTLFALTERNQCLVQNCGNPCSDTFPDTLSPQFPHSRIV